METGRGGGEGGQHVASTLAHIYNERNMTVLML